MLIADLHIHSRYSRATSKDGVPEYLDLWARRKGIDLLGTGDFTHPLWREELTEKLEPAEEGLYILKKKYRLEDDFTRADLTPRFVVTGEISSIYKKNGRVRKVHNLILLPGLAQAEALSHRLEAIGNIHSDGRPILGLDSHDLLEITLDVCPEAVFIPAHIWTPHFSLFGAFSGFDTIEECFEELTPHIHALETGLSSDPPMNWRLSALDSYNLISNSDAHSPAKLGREANLLDIEPSYPNLARAIQGGSGFAGTIEFFPEEGKYHLDGHRKCNLCLNPSDTVKYNGRCPVCGRKITIGVLHRVEELADRAEGYLPAHRNPFESLVPLPEVIAGSTGRTPASAKVQETYYALLRELGPEFPILRNVPVDEIRRIAGPCVAEGIHRLRRGEVSRVPGYDGEYGTIQLISKYEIDSLYGQLSLFSATETAQMEAAAAAEEPDLPAVLPEEIPEDSCKEILEEGPLAGLNTEQRRAVLADDSVIAVIAGPGTGKTKTLVSRIVNLISERQVKPSEITAVTFTNKAAAQLRERLEKELHGKRAVRPMTIGTFHSICLNLLTSWNDPYILADEQERGEIAGNILQECGLNLKPQAFLSQVSAFKTRSGEVPDDPEWNRACARYCETLTDLRLMDFDDLLLRVISCMQEDKEKRDRVRSRFTYLLVDEFQDIDDLQYQLVALWQSCGKNLFVIGDPDQSIYGFRGSNPECFSNLARDNEEMCLIRLINNYRSTPEILSCALPAIYPNGNYARELRPQQKSGPLVSLMTSESDLSEAIFIAKEINRMIGGIDMLDAQDMLPHMEREQPRGFSEIAVLYRTHHQAELIERCLSKEGIPYVVTGREDYLSDETVRGTLSFFRFLLHPEDRAAAVTCLRLIWKASEEAVLAFMELLGEAPAVLSSEYLSQISEQLALRGFIQSFTGVMADFLPEIQKTEPRKLLEHWFALHGTPLRKSVEKLLNTVIFHSTMEDFLNTLLLGEENDLSRSPDRTYSSDAVSLMTLHGSKGLEFPVVFIAGVKKGTIPYESDHHPADAEEERRLFYVGITRAKEELILMTSPEPSVFLNDIPEERFYRDITHRRKALPEAEQLSLFDLM
ncbi:UvrD-helicase domain-containing protein [Anaerolentibacter hominis]|uniref:UvrD-helicase domain-containing protein n=1 Tax=Anaerolentibacter hominis TaxID=3079009 RepID=UPI0031B7F703